MKTFYNFHLTRSVRQLLDYALGNPFDNLTNNFAKTESLKNRIAMLYKNKNSDWALGKYLAVLPLVGLVVLLTAARERGAEAVGSTPLSTQNTETITAGFKNLTEKLAGISGATVEGTTVRGIIKNAQTGEPLPEATIVVSGTGQGTSTDEKGLFEIKNVPLNSSLTFSYVGFVTKQVEITKPNQLLSVSMQREVRPLEQIVVVGYGPAYRPGDGDSAKTALKKDQAEFVVVEQMPEFPGGLQELNKYLAKNIRYPAEASRKGVEGEVLISFTVNEDGAIREPRIVRSVGAGIDEEAMRIVLGMPHWKAAKQHGRPVSMYHTLPIQFMLELDDKVLEDRLNRERRQGNATQFQNYRMPDFNIKNAADYGLPTHSPDNAITLDASDRSGMYQTLKSTGHQVSDQILIIPKDSIPPATFMNYTPPVLRNKALPATFTNYSFPVRLPKN